MIHTRIDDSGVQSVLGAIDGMTSTIKTSKYTGPLLKRVHSIMVREFDSTADVVAMSARDNFHHVYEWNLAGVPQGRLWKHKLSGNGNSRFAGYSWKASKTPIPSPKERASNSKDPMSRLSSDDVAKLSDRKHFFYWKAPVMEYNMTVHIKGRHSPKKMLMIPTWTDNKVGKETKPYVFVSSVTQKVPGGDSTSGRFTGLWASWWAIEAPKVFDREVVAEISSDIKNSIETAIRKRKKTVSIGNSTSSFLEGKRNAQAQLMKDSRRYAHDGGGEE